MLQCRLAAALQSFLSTPAAAAGYNKLRPMKMQCNSRSMRLALLQQQHLL
jgi:hypothetical protein